METRRRIIAVHDRVNRRDQHFRLFLVHWHHYDSLRSRTLIQDVFDTLRPTQVVCDNLINAKQPWDRQKTGESPEAEPLEGGHHETWKVLRDLGWQREGDNHDGKEDGSVQMELVTSCLLHLATWLT